MAFSILALVSTRDSHIKPDCEGPIWEMPCNDIFITYFEAHEMRIYVKHNCNINIFIINITFKNSTKLYYRPCMSY